MPSGRRVGRRGAAVMQAAVAVRERIMRLAGEQLEASPHDLAIEGDNVLVLGSPGARISLRARFGSTSWLEEEAVFDSEDMSLPYGLHLAALGSISTQAESTSIAPRSL